MKGKFIVFEGIDGCGKTTQAKMLNDYLNSKGINTFLTFEPTDGSVGNLIRDFIKDETVRDNLGQKDFNRLMTYLFMADRVLHLSEINKKLNNGVWVISDRYKYSTAAYNYVSPRDYYASSFELLEDFPNPNLTIYIDISSDTAINRINKRSKDKEVFETKKYLDSVIKVYDTFDEFGLFEHVSGEGSLEECHKSVVNLIDKKFSKYYVK